MAEKTMSQAYNRPGVFGVKIFRSIHKLYKFRATFGKDA